MNTLFKAGNRYSYTNPSTNVVNVDQVVALGATGAAGFGGIALTTIPGSGSGELCIGGWPEGVHTLPKNAGEAFTDAQLIYYNFGSSVLTGGTSGSFIPLGRSYGAFASAATSAQLILNAK